MKLALIGQDIPMLLPSLLTDLLFAGKTAADVYAEEKNGAMQAVLQGYGDALFRQAGLGGGFTACGDRAEVLRGADAVIYAGDVMAASRFRMDREALSGRDEDDPFGLTGQARVNGGIGGLLHTLRQGSAVYELCGRMREECPGAVVITLGQPVARTTAMFLAEGFPAYGLNGQYIKGSNGLDAMAQKLGKKDASEIQARVAGLPGFSFLLELKNSMGGDLLSDLIPMVRRESMGRLSARWLKRYGAVAVGDIPAHAEWLPDEEDYIPEKDPPFGETVERRKERILCMNTVSDKGLTDNEAQMAQLLLLSKAPAVRPVRLALALLKKEDLRMESVTRRNNGELPQLPAAAVIESRLELAKGEIVPHGWRMPADLADVCMDIDLTSRLAAQAARGDRSALREAVETDPALEGLDRLYVQDVVDRMIRMHNDIITCFDEEEDEDF